MRHLVAWLMSKPLGKDLECRQSWPEAVGALWRKRSLAQQFVACAAIVLLPAMLAIGFWVSNRIKLAVTESAAASAALYMENFVEPYVQELANGDSLSPESLARLKALLKETTLGTRVVTFKIWQQGGRIIASNRAELIGQSLPPSAGLLRAWDGKTSATFDELQDVENAFERQLGMPILEIYLPLRARGSERIVAVGEFYERAESVKVDIRRAHGLSWLVVAAVTLSMLSALFAIVRRGSQTIERQKEALEQRVGELTRLLDENRQLKQRMQFASVRASENTERYLRRLGSDLHDGPAQLISLVLLRLEEPPVAPLTGPGDTAPSAGSVSDVDTFSARAVLVEALHDLRNIAAGFSVPEIDVMPLNDALRTVIERHQRLTATTVGFECGPLPKTIRQAVKIAAYRLLQEGLSNAFRHAGGCGQTVDVRATQDQLEITIADQGVGMPAQSQPASAAAGQGLRGLTDRIESLGGRLLIKSEAGRGTRLIATMPLHVG